MATGSSRCRARWCPSRPRRCWPPHPQRVARSSYTGGRGWLTLRLDLGEVDWDEVGELITDSYRLVAPKRLAATLAARRPPAG